MSVAARSLVTDHTGGRPPRTLVELGLRAVAEVKLRQHGIKFPDRRWWDNPLEFWRQILGINPWSRQEEVILACRDNERVAVKSGRRVSKSHTVAGLALCFYSSFPDARVVMTSTTARQVDAILWRELLQIRARAGRCIACKTADPEGRRTPRPCPHSAVIDGDAGRLARTGLRMNPLDPGDFREVFGFTASEGEAVQGIAGSHLLFIVDEASGVAPEIFDAINGNRAGGGRVVLFGNPTRTEGELWDAFNEKAKHDLTDPKAPGYFGITISSEESPNVVEGRDIIPGLATREWIEERRHEWGEDSALYRIHVKGEHAVNEDGKAFPVDSIAAAEARWEGASEAGRLFIGLDPAGETGMGDESAFAARRGLKAYQIIARKGLTDEGHLVMLMGIIKERKVGQEIPVVIMDRDGSVGARIYGFLRGHLDALPEHAPPFDLFGLRGSNAPAREGDRYDRQRDATVANLAQWLRDGGAIPEDAKLIKEMHTFEWRQLVTGKMKITPKDEIKKQIGRSPDRFDALCLSVWEPRAIRDDDGPAPGADTAPAAAPSSARRESEDLDDLDVYRGSGIDPYGGR